MIPKICSETQGTAIDKYLTTALKGVASYVTHGVMPQPTTRTYALTDSTPQLVMCVANATDAKSNGTNTRPNITAQVQTYYDRNPPDRNNNAPQDVENPNITVETIEYEDDIIYNASGKKVYVPQIKPVDIYHHGDEFYSHIKDVTIGRDLDRTGKIQSELIAKDSTFLRELGGVSMNFEDWRNMRDYMSLLLQFHQGSKAEKLIADIKTLKLLYGVPGYGESLLLDQFPPSYTKGALLYAEGLSTEQKKNALQEKIRDIEQLMVQVATIPMDEVIRSKEQEWLNNMLNYLKTTSETDSWVYNTMSTKVEQHQWDMMKELVDNLNFAMESEQQNNQEARTINFANVEDYHENDSFPSEIQSWKNVLSNKDVYNVNTEMVGDLEHTETETNKEKEQVENGFQLNSQQFQRLTERDTQWSSLPVPKRTPSFTEKFTRFDYLRAQVQLATRYALSDNKKQLLSFIFGKEPKTKRTKGNTQKVNNSILKYRSEFFNLVQTTRDEAKDKIISLLSKYLTFENLNLEPILGTAKQVIQELRSRQSNVYHAVSKLTGRDIRSVSLQSESSQVKARSQINDVTSIDTNKFTNGELAEYAIGHDPSLKLETIRKEVDTQVRRTLVDLGIVFPQKEPTATVAAIPEEKDDLMARVNEIIKERSESRSVKDMEKLILSIEAKMVEKAGRGETLTTDESESLKSLKELIQDAKKTVDDENISALDRARMERLGIFENVVKSANVQMNRRQTNDPEMIKLDEELVLERELRQLDQLLEQMNRETRREVLSGKEQHISSEIRDNIKEYVRLRNQYSQLARRDQTLREWQQLSLKDKLKFEKENSMGGKYRDIVLGLTRRMQSNQYAESLSYMATSLAQQVAKRKEKEDKEQEELKKIFSDNLIAEKKEIDDLNQTFIEKSELLEKLSVKRRATQKTSENAKLLRDKYGLFTTESEKQLSRILDKYDAQRSRNRGKRAAALEALNDVTSEETIPELVLDSTDNSRVPAELSKRTNVDLTSEQLRDDELLALVKEQVAIQARHRAIRIDDYNRAKQQNLVDQDPAHIVLGMSTNQSLTPQQRELYQRYFDREYNDAVTKWRKLRDESIRLTVAPRVLKATNSAAAQSSSNLYDKLVPKTADGELFPNIALEDIHEPVTDGLKLQQKLNEPLFPEKPWEGDTVGLQLAYLKQQIERSQDPRYVRNWFINHGDPSTYAFWKGIWELPESISNFLQVRLPTIKKREIPPPPPPPPTKKKVEAPPPPAQLPIVPPIVQPPPIQPMVIIFTIFINNHSNHLLHRSLQYFLQFKYLIYQEFNYLHLFLHLNHLHQSLLNHLLL